jgi:branched-chain amino acid transport system permease protein
LGGSEEVETKQQWGGLPLPAIHHPGALNVSRGEEGVIIDIGLILQLVVNGLMTGGIYALVASGFNLILGVMQVFNFAQGQFYMLGAYATFGIVTGLGLSYPLGLLAALLATLLLGVLFHFGIIKWTLSHGFFHTMLATIAFGNLVSQAALLTFARDQGVVAPLLSGAFSLRGITLNKGKLLVIAGAVVVMAVLYYFMKSKTGTAMLASAENRDVAGLQGINAKRIFWVTMAAGCGLCGIAGSLIVPVLSATNTMGMDIFVRSMLVVLIGGTGSMAGALLASFVVGIIESFAFQYVGQLSLLAIFAFTAVLIYFRPGGLLGKPLPIPGE